MGQADYRGEKGQRKNKVLLVKPYGLKGTGLTKASKKGYVNVWIEPGHSILDGEIVVVSRTEVIIKIYQGWYLLEKT